MTDLDELQKLAENAKLGSHGQWLHDQGHVMLPDEPGNDWDGEIVTQPARQVDAEFIAAANPQAVLELIERVRRVEAERDAALAAVERVRAVLVKWEERQELNREILDSGALGHFQAIDCTGDLRAALDGAPEPEEKP